MATLAKLHISPLDYHHRTGQPPVFNRHVAMWDPISLKGRRSFVQKCKSFRQEKESEVVDTKKEMESNEVKSERGVYKLMSSLKSSILRVSKLRVDKKFVEDFEENLSSIALHIGRYIVTMMGTGVILLTGFQLSGGDGQMNDLIWYSWLGGIIIGTMIGSNMVLDEVSRAGPRNVVITGSTRGLGKALAREFLLSGDRVVVASRSPESVEMTIKELEDSLKECLESADDFSRRSLKYAEVVGIACDVSDPKDVEKLSDFAVNEFGSIDIWINNAGTNKGFRPLLQFSDEDIQQIVSTNLVGSIICTREAMRVMGEQHKGGHIFNMDGAGSGGSSTPLTAVYGSTKCGLRQLQSSLLKESKKSKVGVHTASPGMVLTDLLLSGSTVQNKQMFNIICELPETVARTLVPRMRVVKGNGKAINYLTPPRILIALVTAWVRRGRWFDDKGRALYASEADRLRNWAESRTRLSITDAMESYTEDTWVSVFSLSVVFFSNHYSGKELDLHFGDGEAWKKVYGPVFVYLNSASTKNVNDLHSTLWTDAKQKASIEQQSWPSSFPLSNDYPHADQRGTVRGRLQVSDRYMNQGLINAESAYVGLAPKGDEVSWQKENKGYQFWNQMDATGNFLLKGVRLGNYNLYVQFLVT